MNKYPKIKTVYKRDPRTRHRTLLVGEWSTPEFEYLAADEWNFFEKVDGTNIRVIWDSALQTVEFRGRTDNAQVPNFLLERLLDIFPVSKFTDVYPTTPMTLYGEGFGNKIQKAGKFYRADGVDFILFDVFIGGFWLTQDNVQDIADHLGIRRVPLVATNNLFEAVFMVQDGFKSVVAETEMIAEGLIMRPKVDLLTRTGDRIIAKVKHKDFGK